MSEDRIGAEVAVEKLDEYLVDWAEGQEAEVDFEKYIQELMLYDQEKSGRAVSLNMRVIGMELRYSDCTEEEADRIFERILDADPSEEDDEVFGISRDRAEYQFYTQGYGLYTQL